MNELDLLLKEFGINIRLFFGTETTEDPNYDNKTVSMLNSLPVRALVSDISYAKAKWSMPGIKSGIIKEITCEKRHRALIEKSRKILIDGSYFYGYKPANGDRIQIKQAGDYLIILVTTDETL